MYRILLVDDEPLILAGIKTLADWRAAGCELVGSARNGEQALQMMEALRPDIVFADIHMPAMNGIELLKQAESLYPDAVFIMLTNLQEFDMVRESLRHRAADYLVKTQLDEPALLNGLEKAKAESDKRKTDRGFILEHRLREISESQLLANSLKLLISSPEIPAETVQALQDANALSAYALIAVRFMYPDHYVEWEKVPVELEDLLRWEREVADALIKNCFTSAVMAETDLENEQLLMLAWNLNPAHYERLAEDFYKKLTAASSSITGIKPCLLVSDIFSGKDSVVKCRKQLFEMDHCFYLTGQDFIRHSRITNTAAKPLGLSGISGSLKKELNGKNAAGCKSLISRAVSRIQDEPHEKSQALWLCTELYSVICETQSSQPDAAVKEGIFSDSSAGYAHIKRLSTREDVVAFLTVMGNELQSLLQSETSGHAETIGQIKQYVYENIEKRITLHETANKAYLSAGYLSAIFKKYNGENFMDFVNRCKIEKACELLKQEDKRIGQISNTLSFENAYCFAKVFKRYTGVTPSEYRNRM
ncbi:MAG: response regulator [Clostridiales bacterium]|jgi:two-component system response regulator YesN|nr:response regulator [Clostridiales bacterium]